MSDIAIKADKIGKHYRIGELKRYKALRDTLTDALYAPFRAVSSVIKGKRLNSKDSPSGNFIWALKDVSFEIKRGEVVGVIGRNGAGKSTLLKILSRITEPTEGYAEMHGRVGSLLEVGTGFHPELTGRENIYLNGAILGMRKKEINRKFDEMVSFAEIEKFIDTPVKFYSSGMYVRLAFAVAANLEPEILLVDEVLAVGDVAFQKKCLGKMGDVARGGRTVLFVSHNMAAVNKLCQSALWVDAGQVKMRGPVETVVGAYLVSNADTKSERRWERLEESPVTDEIRLRAVRVVNLDGTATSNVESQHPFYVEIEYELFKSNHGLQVGFWLVSSEGIVVFATGDREDSNWLDKLRYPGRYKSKCKVPGLLLNSGLYSITVAADIRNTEILFIKESVLTLSVELTRIPAHSHAKPQGVICPFLEWQVSKLQ